jgi:hypothetical protein
MSLAGNPAALKQADKQPAMSATEADNHCSGTVRRHSEGCKENRATTLW